MLPDRVSNPGPLTYESGALPIALRGPAGWPYSVNKWTGQMEQQTVRKTGYLYHTFPKRCNNNH